MVAPLLPSVQPTPEGVRRFADWSHLPIWLPWPLPHGWVVAGTGHAGADNDRARATVLALNGPNPLGGAGELLLVAEEPGVGLGAYLSGIDGPDPGEKFGLGQAEAKVDADGHPTSLWHVPAPPDRAVYAGEAAGLWIWLILFPETAGTLLMEPITLADVRGMGREVEMLPFGALTPRLPGVER
ncbi:hypothetical protein JOD67_002730 [Tenggerimyces flavus]|nr:hypothetical protein [Tenggerimyces flavus]